MPATTFREEIQAGGLTIDFYYGRKAPGRHMEAAIAAEASER